MTGGRIGAALLFLGALITSPAYADPSAGVRGDPFKGGVDVPRGKYVLLPIATYIWTFFDPCAEIRCARRIINDNFLNHIDDVPRT